jgi:hypothetical protein
MTPRNSLVRALPVLLVAGLLTLSCASTSNHALLARPSASAADLLRSAQPFEELGPVEGQACRWFVLAIIPFGDSTPGAAMEKALAGKQADAILNASVTTSLYGFVPIYNVLSFTCTTVRGVAVRFERPGS